MKLLSVTSFALAVGLISLAEPLLANSRTLVVDDLPSTPLVWGSNSAGQLGYPNPVSDLSPDLVVGLGPGSGVVAIAARAAHSLALKSDGTVLAWGSNANGQLGDGTTTPRLIAVAVSGLGPGSGVVAIVAGGNYSLALKSDGTVLAWGGNSTGQLGDGTLTQRTTPVAVGGLSVLSGVAAIAAGSSHSLALKTDGTVLAWGGNANGQLGDGTLTQRNAPVAVRDLGGVGVLSGVMAIDAGGNDNLALKTDGTVLAWGNNSTGQLGDGTTTQRTTPVQVKDPSDPTGFLTGVKAIAAGRGGQHNLALRSAGTVLAWGLNAAGQLGDGTTTQRTTPVQVNGLGPDTGVLAIAAGGSHSAALKSDGAVLAWGFNANGQLGDGTATNRPTPVQVSALGPDSGAVTIAPGGSHGLALKSDGTVLAWGNNANGQLGNGSILAKLQPSPVAGLGRIVATAGGAQFSLALSVDTTVVAWGANPNGQLGDGTTTTRVTPLQVLDPLSPSGFLTDVGAIAAGGGHSLALKSDGTVMAWGFNGLGQLGDGTTTPQSTTPVQVSGLGPGSGVVAIASAGGSHSLALKTDGTVLAWGFNGIGQLGDGTTTQRITPVQVGGLGSGSGVVAIAAGGSHSLALKSDGTVLAWGVNTNGQLGLGDIVRRLTPVAVIGLGPGSGVVAIAAGGAHSLALKSDGTIAAWGANAIGQLGDGSGTQRLTPVQVMDPFFNGVLTGVVAIVAGGSHSLALTSEGTTLAWGANPNGQLGDGTLENRLTPVLVSGLGPDSGLVQAIAASAAHSLALVDTPPTCTCVQGVNPSMKNVPAAHNQNEDGFYLISATDDVTPSSDLLIKLGGYSLINGETIKITQSPGQTGVKLVNEMGQSDIRHFRVDPGDAVITATDQAGNVGSITCFGAAAAQIAALSRIAAPR